MLRGAIIGLGNIAARGHVPAYRDEEVSGRLRITAVMDVVEQNREKAREHLPGAKFYTDLPALLDQEKPDFVDICTPPHTHAAYITACAARGIHVICEKPLTESLETSAAVTRAVREAKIVFVPCHQYKYSPLWKSIRGLIADGTLGEVVLAQFSVFRLHADAGTAAWNPEWRTEKKHSGGGILVDTGAHYFYLTQYFFGVPERVSSILRTLKHHQYGVEDTAIVTLEYPKTLVQINLTWAANTRANSALVIGTRGTLSYDGTSLLHSTGGETRELPMPDISDKKQYVRWYAELFAEFARRAERKETSTELLQEAEVVMKLLNECYTRGERPAAVRPS